MLMLFKLFCGSSKEPYELALVRWYEIDPDEPQLYGCSQLYYAEECNAIPIGSINQMVYIVPRFNEENRFLLNKYILISKKKHDSLSNFEEKNIFEEKNDS